MIRFLFFLIVFSCTYKKDIENHISYLALGGYDISIYSKDFEKLLIKAIGYSKNKNNVFVLSIPDYGVTSFISSEEDKKKIYNEINSYNSINKMISKKYNVMYFDITEISRSEYHLC